MVFLKSRLPAVILICFLLLLAITRGGQLASTFRLNLAKALIHNSFSSEQSAARTRQRTLALAAAFLESELLGSADDTTTEHNTAMIPAALRGLFYHRLEEWENAAFWYRIAAQGEPTPSLQQQIMISPWMKLTPSGDFMLETVLDEWNFRADTASGAISSITDRETLLFSCSESTEIPQRAVLVWNQTFDIPYHHTWVIRAKTEKGSTLILEAVIDGQLVRHLVETGTGQWENYTVSVNGDNVKYIYLQVREDINSSEESCLAEIDSLTFLLDK